MTIVCSRCDGNHMRSECPKDDWITEGADTSWAALMATKEAFRKQAFAAEREAARLRTALEFYSDPKNYSDDYWKGMWETARDALALSSHQLGAEK